MDTTVSRHYLLASDFDKTLSYNDSGLVLAEILGIPDFESKVAGLAESSLVQQGGELAYLIRHDPEFRGVRREHLVQAGQRVRLKKEIPALLALLDSMPDNNRFTFCVISAAPRDVVVSALHGIVSPGQIFGTELEYSDSDGEVSAVNQVAAGFGKVAVLDSLAARFDIPSNRIIYVGDGSSDMHVMLHVNNQDGFTIAVSDDPRLAKISTRTVLSDNALSIAVPILDQVLGWSSARIRDAIESKGLILQEWDRARTDRLTIVNLPQAAGDR